MAPRIQWTAPEGFSVSAIHWPQPHHLKTPGSGHYIYDDELVLLVDVTPPTQLPGLRTVSLMASVQWLACRDVCVRGESKDSLTLPVAGADTAESLQHPRPFKRARERCPRAGHRLVPAALERWDGELVLIVRLPDESIVDPNKVYFFPEEEDIVDPGAAQFATGSPGRVEIRMQPSDPLRPLPDFVRGVLVTGPAAGDSWNIAARSVPKLPQGTEGGSSIPKNSSETRPVDSGA